MNERQEIEHRCQIAHGVNTIHQLIHNFSGQKFTVGARDEA